MPFRGEIFLAIRYLKPQKSLITLLTYLSLLGPMLGVAVLLVVMSVMNGMPKALVESLIEYNPHIVLENKTTLPDVDNLIEHIDQQYKIKASPVTPLKVFLEKDKNIQPFPAKGIYPFTDRSYQQVTNLFGKVIKEDYKLKDDEVLLSTTTGLNYNLQIGDKITLHSPAKYKEMLKSQKGDNLRRFNINSAKVFKIAGYYNVSFANRIDQQFIIMHQDTANELLSMNWGDSLTLEMKLEEPYISKALIKKFQNDPILKDFKFMPWQEMSNGVYLRIRQEKKQIAFVLFLIMGATGIGIGACIFSLVIQKTKDIGILKATGVTPGSIILIFLGQGAFIGILGSSLGFAIGLAALEYRTKVAEFLGKFDSNIGNLKNIPMFLDPSDIQMILWGAISICLLAAIVPAVIAASINPVKALHSGN